MTAEKPTMPLNQRTTHRIEEEVLLACRPVDQGSPADPDAHGLFEPSALAELGRQLAHLDQQFRECHTRLARIDAIAAEAMQLLDAKVTVLRDVVTQSAAEKTGAALERVIASLGANGLGFTSPQPLDIGTTVALHLVLLPQRESIVGRGRVCRTHPVAAGHHVGGSRAHPRCAGSVRHDRAAHR